MNQKIGSLNYDYITNGLEILTESLVPYVYLHLSTYYGNEWWKRGVYNSLSQQMKRDIPEELSSFQEFEQCIDVLRCLILLDYNWKGIFQSRLKRESIIWIKELIHVRNKWAHKGVNDFEESYVNRSLETMYKIIEQIDSGKSEELKIVLDEFKNKTTISSFRVCVTPERLKRIIKEINKYSTDYNLEITDDNICITHFSNLLINRSYLSYFLRNMH